jgi:hypothetical protein
VSSRPGNGTRILATLPKAAATVHADTAVTA